MAPAVLEHFLEIDLPVFTGKKVAVRMINGLPFAALRKSRGKSGLGGGARRHAGPSGKQRDWRVSSRSTGWRERRRRRESRSLVSGSSNGFQ